jgi:membrane-bound lytic murein transglycosylase B
MIPRAIAAYMPPSRHPDIRLRPMPRLHRRAAPPSCRYGLCALLAIGLTLPAQAAKPRRVALDIQGKTQPAGVRGDDAPDLVTYGRRNDVTAYAAEVAARRGLDPAWVLHALEQARFVPSVARFIMPAPAGTAKNWASYRGRFVEPLRIRAGVAFWRANRAWLMLAEERYGVPAEIVVGIVGVETIYGQQMGGFRTLDALATLSFDFPTGRKDRSAFFRDELENFLVLCDRERCDPQRPKGSFAGAMGMPQFMPSSVNRYAVDFDGDGHIDLAASTADVIGSVAHYLAAFGWQRGLPTRFDVAVPVDAADRAVLLGPDIVPTFTVADFAARGARLGAAALAFDALQAGPGNAAPTSAAAPAVAASAVAIDSMNASTASATGAASASSDEPSATPAPMKLALVELQNGDAAPSYVAGTANFYAITRYNWSSYYAMAVIELGEAVARSLR